MSSLYLLKKWKGATNGCIRLRIGANDRGYSLHLYALCIFSFVKEIEEARGHGLMKTAKEDTRIKIETIIEILSFSPIIISFFL